MNRTIRFDEWALELVQDSKCYVDRMFRLHLSGVDEDGGEVVLELDGVHLADLVADAARFGIPGTAADLVKRCNGN